MQSASDRVKAKSQNTRARYRERLMRVDHDKRCRGEWDVGEVFFDCELEAGHEGDHRLAGTISAYEQKPGEALGRYVNSEYEIRWRAIERGNPDA